MSDIHGHIWAPCSPGCRLIVRGVGRTSGELCPDVFSHDIPQRWPPRTAQSQGRGCRPSWNREGRMGTPRSRWLLSVLPRSPRGLAATCGCSHCPASQVRKRNPEEGVFEMSQMLHQHDAKLGFVSTLGHSRLSLNSGPKSPTPRLCPWRRELRALARVSVSRATRLPAVTRARAWPPRQRSTRVSTFSEGPGHVFQQSLAKEPRARLIHHYLSLSDTHVLTPTHYPD